MDEWTSVLTTAYLSDCEQLGDVECRQSGPQRRVHAINVQVVMERVEAEDVERLRLVGPVGVVVGVCCYLKKKKMADPSVKLPV